MVDYPTQQNQFCGHMSWSEDGKYSSRQSNIYDKYVLFGSIFCLFLSLLKLMTLGKRGEKQPMTSVLCVTMFLVPLTINASKRNVRWISWLWSQDSRQHVRTPRITGGESVSASRCKPWSHQASELSREEALCLTLAIMWQLKRNRERFVSLFFSDVLSKKMQVRCYHDQIESDWSILPLETCK